MTLFWGAAWPKSLLRYSLEYKVCPTNKIMKKNKAVDHDNIDTYIRQKNLVIFT